MADSLITIEGLVARPGPSMATLQWAINDPNEDGLTYLRFDIAEVWRSTNSNMSGAVKVAEAYTAWCDTSVRVGLLKYYQVRARDRSGQYGAFSPIVVSRDNSEISLFETYFIPGTIGSSSRNYLVTKVGMVFQWGSSTSDINGTCTAFLNTTTARMLPRFVTGITAVPGDDGYPGTGVFTGWEGGRKPLWPGMSLDPGGFATALYFYCRRIQSATKFGSQPVNNLDFMRESFIGFTHIADSGLAQQVNWLAIGNKVI